MDVDGLKLIRWTGGALMVQPGDIVLVYKGQAIAALPLESGEAAIVSKVVQAQALSKAKAALPSPTKGELSWLTETPGRGSGERVRVSKAVFKFFVKHEGEDFSKAELAAHLGTKGRFIHSIVQTLLIRKDIEGLRVNGSNSITRYRYMPRSRVEPELDMSEGA